MRISRWAKRWLTGNSRVDLPSPYTTEATLEVDGEFHEEIVLLLPIVNGVALTDLSGREKTEKTAVGDRPRVLR